MNRSRLLILILIACPLPASLTIGYAQQADTSTPRPQQLAHPDGSSHLPSAWDPNLLEADLLDANRLPRVGVVDLHVSEMDQGRQGSLGEIVSRWPKEVKVQAWSGEVGVDDRARPKRLAAQRQPEEIPIGAQQQDSPDDPFRQDDDEVTERLQWTRKHLAELRKPMADVRIQASQRGPVPDDRAAAVESPKSTVAITAAGFGPPLPDRYPICFAHRPLYYEQPRLERCGRGFRYLQNAVSMVQFVTGTIVLPYRVCAQPACCPVPSGGDCLTCQAYPIDCNPFPLDRGGVITEAAAVAGFSFLLL